MTKPDGGPAFPSGQIDRDRGAVIDPFNMGMSLRDWFAGRALAGLIVADAPRSSGPDAIARDAYLFADAMMKERDI